MNFPKSDYNSLVEFYGNIGENQTIMELPFPMRLAWNKSKTLTKSPVTGKYPAVCTSAYPISTITTTRICKNPIPQPRFIWRMLQRQKNGHFRSMEHPQLGHSHRHRSILQPPTLEPLTSQNAGCSNTNLY